MKKTITVVFGDAPPFSMEGGSWGVDKDDYVIRDKSGIIARIPRERVLYVTAVDAPTYTGGTDTWVSSGVLSKGEVNQ